MKGMERDGMPTGLAYLEIEQEPYVLLLWLAQVLEQVSQPGHALLGLPQRLEGAQIFPVAIGNLCLLAKAPFEGTILGVASAPSLA